MPSADPAADGLPAWVPEEVRRYVAHTVFGRTIRTLARDAGCHASTVLRQIRRIEQRRDDPLVDAALDRLAARHGSCGHNAKDQEAMTVPQTSSGLPAERQTGPRAAIASRPDRRSDFRGECGAGQNSAESEAHFEREALRVLRRLCEPGAVLAVAENMEKAVVMRDDSDGTSTRTAIVDAAVAQGMALKDWILCPSPGRVSKYRITAMGRSALNRFLAAQENAAREESDYGFADAQRPFGSGPARFRNDADCGPGDRSARRMRYVAVESPLTALSRRRDGNGQPFLTPDLVRAGERLREDFELSQMGPSIAQNWESFLTGGVRSIVAGEGASRGTAGARDRLRRALGDLGPGLSDVALRCCCMLEGLETAEKRLGWSARSGKIVLRIALQRLKRHYEETALQDRMIG
ncbi:DUF6456 domain-containing protein [Chachezhania sediminis]|uniref:DUF6456 domain-containing protein n=1 Tax=Chachezhania sediminis TaxID=2599291 RepID=UPI00131D6675|nr:DUF6456 domain-containing protein [Chachezhania sediminis]